MPKRRFIFNPPPPPPPPPPEPTTFEDGYGRQYTFTPDTEVRQLYPKLRKANPTRAEARKAGFNWRIDYALVFDDGRSCFTIYYRTYLGAIVAAWWWEHVWSWGGSVILIHEKDS